MKCFKLKGFILHTFFSIFEAHAISLSDHSSCRRTSVCLTLCSSDKNSGVLDIFETGFLQSCWSPHWLNIANETQGSMFPHRRLQMSLFMPISCTYAHRSLPISHSLPSHCKPSGSGAFEGILIGPSRQVISSDGMCSHGDVNDRAIAMSHPPPQTPTHTHINPNKDYMWPKELPHSLVILGKRQ